MTDDEPSTDDAPDGGPDDAPGEAAALGPDGQPRRKRRRRRRRGGGEAAVGAPIGTGDASTSAGAPAGAPRPTAAASAETPPGAPDTQPAPTQAQPSRDPQRERSRRGRGRDARNEGGRERAPVTTQGGSGAPGGDPRRGGQDSRGGREARGGNDARGSGGRGGPQRDGGGNRSGRQPRPNGGEPQVAASPASAPPERAPQPAPMARLEQQQRRRPTEDVDDAPAETPSVAWGFDDDGPAPDIVLAPDLPAEPPRDDDPLTHPMFDSPPARLGEDVASVCGVRFVPSGRLQWFDASDSEYATGERVLVDSERGSRLGWIAVPPTRRAMASRDRLRRVIRRANDQDLRGEREGATDRARVLRFAKDKAAALRLPLKVFRVEVSGQGRGAKVNVYYTSDDRLDLREFVHSLGAEVGGGRIELRQLGVRDEAKAVGGIGSCGLTLCCTTWLPDFVPVSIKMAKDQGLVLSPSKVSGQCGRLKCCLVYEQAGYAELRKGLPKLGKRVIGARGEGRVVEVDVLRQRVRVSYGPGDTEVVPAAEVKPLFPAGTAPPRGPRGDQGTGRDVEAADDDGPTDDPSAGPTDDPSAQPDDPDLGPTDDPSAYPDSPDLPDDDAS